MTLTPRDSGKTFKGPAEICGGLTITGWTDRGGGVWGAKLPIGPTGRVAYFEQLWVNGRRAVRARFPDKGYLHPAGFRVAKTGPESYRQELDLGEDAQRIFADISNEDLAHAQLVVHTHWDFTRRPIDGMNAATRTVCTHGRSPWNTTGWNSWETNDLCYVENLRGAFDSPGEWFYDAGAGEVLYRPLPGEAIRSAFAPVDGLATLVKIEGNVERGEFVHDIVFENVTFSFTAPVEGKGPVFIPARQGAYYAGSAVVVDGARHITFRNCRFRHTGGYGVWFRRGCMSNVVENCVFEDLGAGGVRIGEFYPVPRMQSDAPGKPKATVPVLDYSNASTAFNQVEDCLIRDGGKYHPSGVGVIVGHSSDNRIIHNDITDLYYTGVSLGWSWGYAGSCAQRNEVSFNRIWNIGQSHLADMAAVYTLGTSFGTVISNNVIHTVKTYSYGGWGLYFDEGSEGIVMENNLVYDTDDGSFQQHYGRNNVFRNNIGVGARRDAVCVPRPAGNDRDNPGFAFEGNIMVWSAPTMPMGADENKIRLVDWSSNCWWCVNGPVDFNGKDYQAWCRVSGERGGYVANPQFVNAEKGDYRLKCDSPALKHGFRPFDPRRAGRRDFRNNKGKQEVE